MVESEQEVNPLLVDARRGADLSLQGVHTINAAAAPPELRGRKVVNGAIAGTWALKAGRTAALLACFVLTVWTVYVFW